MVIDISGDRQNSNNCSLSSSTLHMQNCQVALNGGRLNLLTPLTKQFEDFKLPIYNSLRQFNKQLSTYRKWRYSLQPLSSPESLLNIQGCYCRWSVCGCGGKLGLRRPEKEFARHFFRRGIILRVGPTNCSGGFHSSVIRPMLCPHILSKHLMSFFVQNKIEGAAFHKIMLWCDLIKCVDIQIQSWI